MDPWLILLDREATADIFCNPKMLTNICRVKETLLVHCNARSKGVNTKGFLKGYWDVWFCKEFIANIISLANVADCEDYHVWFDN